MRPDRAFLAAARRLALSSAFLAVAVPPGSEEHLKPLLDAFLPPENPANTALLQEARDNATAIANAAPSPYSPGIAALQAELDLHLAQNPSPFYDSIIVLDPARIDALNALGVPRDEAVRTQLAEKGYPDAEDDHVAALSYRISVWETASGRIAQTLSPGTKPLPDEAACIVLPLPAYALFSGDNPFLAELGVDGTIAFTNRHEAWHCKDRAYDAREAFALDPEADWSSLRALADDATAMAALSVYWKKETISDVGSLGDMIRKDGYYPSVIGAVASIRAGLCAGDILHCPIPALEALEGHIRDTGLAAFRETRDEDAEDLYVRLVEGTGFGPSAMRAFILATQNGMKDLTARDLADPAAAPGLRLAAIAVRGQDISPQKPATGSARWNPEKILEDKAFETAGQLTPASLLAAYNAVQGGLKARLEAQPRDFDAAEKAVQLRALLPGLIANSDYAATNAARAPRL